MKKFFHKFVSLSLIIFTFSIFPLQGIAIEFPTTGNYFLATSEKNIINYEKSQPSAISNPVVDPNFNTMRSTDMDSSSATYFVIALIVVASIVPLATWYFSRSKTN